MSQTTKKAKQFKEFNDDDECSGSGPRPPIPGEESRSSKMTSESECSGGGSGGGTVGCGSSTIHQSNDAINDSCLSRISRWQEQLVHLLADQEGVQLLFKFVKNERDPGSSDSIDFIRLKFYFACEGLKKQTNEKMIRKIIQAIYTECLRKITAFHCITEEFRSTIKKIVRKELPADRNIFNELQKNVEETIGATSYLAFLQSDIFIQHVEQIKQRGTVSGGNSTQTSIIGGSGGIGGNCISGNSISTNSSGGTSYSSGMNAVGLSPSLVENPHFQTLHEDTELSLNESVSHKSSYDRSMPKLTKDNLLATQKGRLEVRPPGAHGYTYDVSFNSSFNPVSRQDSERQSLSSASLTDSETRSFHCSKDGKPFSHRKPSSAEDYRRSYLNPPVMAHKTIVKPLSEGVKEIVEPLSKSRCETAARPLDTVLLTDKLQKLKKEQEDKEQLERSINLNSNERLSSQPRQKAISEALKKLPSFEEDAQLILDQHVSCVFSPHLSPGTMSPRQAMRMQHRVSDTSTTDFAIPAMRLSKSIPEHASSLSAATKKLVSKWPSTNIDSGISLYSADLPYKAKELKSTEQQLEETTRKLQKDEARRTRRQQMPATSHHHQSTAMPMPSTQHHYHTNSLPRITEQSDDYTYVMYTFCDENIPYRTRIPGKRITLKHFKDYSPKKGNFRFFFTTHCDDPENPVIQEEVVNDNDILPLYEGKIMGTVKPL